ncbi:MAG: DUF2493 domain-containing protein [Clostridia bacterium]|nr:DUF2493 domain-containing protein [Clostridia bacterium]
MKLLIAGSRSILDFDLDEYVSSDVDLIICGGAKGIDEIAEKYADDHKISKLVLRPNYALYGRAAPIKRNEIMVDIADKVLVIWDGKSRGAQYTAKYAEKNGKKTVLILADEKL